VKETLKQAVKKAMDYAMGFTLEKAYKETMKIYKKVRN